MKILLINKKIRANYPEQNTIIEIIENATLYNSRTQFLCEKCKTIVDKEKTPDNMEPEMINIYGLDCYLGGINTENVKIISVLDSNISKIGDSEDLIPGKDIISVI